MESSNTDTTNNLEVVYEITKLYKTEPESVAKMIKKLDRKQLTYLLQIARDYKLFDIVYNNSSNQTIVQAFNQIFRPTWIKYFINYPCATESLIKWGSNELIKFTMTPYNKSIFGYHMMKHSRFGLELLQINPDEINWDIGELNLNCYDVLMNLLKWTGNKYIEYLLKYYTERNMSNHINIMTKWFLVKKIKLKINFSANFSGNPHTVQSLILLAGSQKLLSPYNSKQLSIGIIVNCNSTYYKKYMRE
jgi:hypothetical protein